MFRRRAKPDEFGKTPDVEYFQGGMDCIRSYHDHMRSAHARAGRYLETGLWS